MKITKEHLKNIVMKFDEKVALSHWGLGVPSGLALPQL